MFSFFRRRKSGVPFYLVRELTDVEWTNSVRVNLWNGLVASIEGSEFVLLHGDTNSSMRVAGIALATLGRHNTEARQDLAACSEWQTFSPPTIQYLNFYAQNAYPKTVIAVIPTGMFKQIGLKLQRSHPRVDIFNSLIVKIETGSKTYSRIQVVHDPVTPIDDFTDEFTRGVEVSQDRPVS